MEFKQIKAIEERNKIKLKNLFPNIPYTSGIYVLIRKEGDFKYAYIGQAMRLLDRLAQHLTGYQHIDLSLKKRGLYSEDNPTGWNVLCKEYPLTELNDMEQEYIKYYANNGYQLYNHTTGSQGQGKQALGEGKSTKTYREGLAQGYKNAQKEVAKLFEKNLTYAIKGEPNKNKEKALAKFEEFIKKDEEK
jgi:hypothetical protein